MTVPRRHLLCLFLLQIMVPGLTQAHEVRPAYLDVRERQVDEFAILWKVPALGDRRLALYVRVPEVCREAKPVVSTFDAGAMIERWTVICPGGLEGQSIHVDGLRTSLTDVLARVEHLDGFTQITRLTPETPSFVLRGVPSRLDNAKTYFVLGVEHILMGVDHLCFVLALILLIDQRWKLVKTITAFTIAHSITLAASALGYMSLRQSPVEAVIALSIVFLAIELTKTDVRELRFSRRAPWLVAFAFGLLHGFGFAGELREIGLPQTEVPLALLTFNLGVETGQLLFVGAALLVFAGIRALGTVPFRPIRAAAAYGIGAISTFWLIQRVAGL